MSDALLTCSKLYRDVPFAHRQAAHGGHCRFVHGHNWAFRFTFAARERDRCGFVVDFGKLHDLARLVSDFDHALVLSESDPELEAFRALEAAGLCDLVLVPDPSCEGLAAYLLDRADELVRDMTGGRVRVVRVDAQEDSRNAASAECPMPLRALWGEAAP